MSFLEHELTAHSTALRALARVLVGEPNADDLVQDTTLQVLRAPPPQLTGLRGWLTAVLRHRASKHHRGESRRRARSRWLTEPEPAATPERLLERKETIERLHLALTSLPEPYQSTLLLRFFEDLTPTAIAVQTRTSLATVKSRLQRGIGLLRDRMPGAGDRRDWRQALAAAFGLDGTQLAGRGLGAASAGVLLMTAKLPLLAGTALVLAVWLFPWDRGGQPPTPSNEPAARGGDAPAGAWAIAPDAASLSGSERTPVAGNVPPAPIRARIVDAFDRAPLPFYAVQIVDPEAPDAEPLTSDANGELSLDGTLRGRAGAIQAIDDPEHGLSNRQVRDVAADGWPAATQVLELPFQTGPTYTLLFETPPPEGADLAVSLLAGAKPRLDWRGDAFVRRGPLPWVRFDPHSTNASALGEGPWTLTVLDRSGLWVAWGAVQTARGIQQQPVAMRCDRRGAIAVHASEGGRDLAGPFHASVYRLGADGKPFGADTTEHGTHSRVRIPFLEPGRYVVYVGRLDDASYREHVTVQAGDVIEVRAEFAVREPRPPLRVIARSQTGRRDLSALSFYARRPDGSGWRPSTFGPPPAAEPLATKPLEVTYESHFADLPPGEWIVALEPPRRLPPWNHTEQRVRADSGIVEFTCLDEGAPPEVSIAVRVVRAGNGAPIAYAGVTTYADHEAWMLMPTGADGAVRIGTFLAGQPIQLLVRAAGCQPAWIETTAPSTADAEPVRVELQPGWGTLLQVVEPSPEVRGGALPNVQVLLEGVLAGTTDERGRIVLRSGTRPRRIDLRRDGYTVQYGSIDAATGAPESQEQHAFFVVMHRK